VFENVLRVEANARASVREMSFRLPTLRDVARILLVVFGLGAAAAALLFFGWLIFSDSHRQAAWGFGPEWDCTKMGRGGAYCIKSSSNPAQSNRGSGPEEECTSLGRGGLVCIKHPVNGEHSNRPTGA
jgi:hypothetical protein